MATQSWLYGASGDWSNAANWVSGTVPGATDDVTINSYASQIRIEEPAGTFSFVTCRAVVFVRPLRCTVEDKRGCA